VRGWFGAVVGLVEERESRALRGPAICCCFLSKNHSDTLFVVQVRAHGRVGASDWSESVTLVAS
jgi:hypothetical protein